MIDKFYIVWDLLRILIAIAFPIAVLFGPAYIYVPLGVLLAAGLVESLIFRTQY